MQARPSLHALTGARFFAALGVLLVHFQYASAKSLPEWTEKTGLGGSGVAFFFVLSGFILTYNYAHVFAQGTSAATLRAYGAARVARIAPVYLLTLAIGAGAAVFMRGTPAIGVPLDASNLGHWLIAGSLNLGAVQAFIPVSSIQNAINAPAWSVSCEAFFYLLLPPALLLIGRYRPSFAMLASLGAMLILAQWVLHEAISFAVVEGATGTQRMDARLWIERFPPFRLFEFLVGCCAGAMFLQQRSKRGTGLLLTAAAMYAGIEAVRLTSGGPDFPRLVLLCPVFALAIYALACGTVANRAMESPPMKLLGEASYSLYLLHWTPLMLLQWAMGWGSAPLWLTALVGLSCIPLSIAMYLWFEQPMRLRLRGFGTKHRMQPAES